MVHRPLRRPRRATPQSGVDAFYERYPLIAHAVKTVDRRTTRTTSGSPASVWRRTGATSQAFFPGRTHGAAGQDPDDGKRLPQGRQAGPDPDVPASTDRKSAAASSTSRRPSRSTAASSATATSSTRSPPGLHAGREPDRADQRLQLRRAKRAGAGFTSRAAAHLPDPALQPWLGTGRLRLHRVPHARAIGGRRSERRQGRNRKRRRTKGRRCRITPPTCKSDWIVDNTQARHRSSTTSTAAHGDGMAVSLCDLHLQNMIVHGKAPHLIDLEEALKRPMTRRETDTYLVAQPTSSPLGKLPRPERPALRDHGRRDDRARGRL